MTDPATQKALIGTAAASGTASWWTAAKEIALELFGVPLQVVLAAAAGAFLARSFMANETGYLRAVAGGALWTIVGTVLAQLLLALIAAWLDKEIPTGALSGVALIVSAGGQFVVPVMAREGPEALRRWLQNLWRRE